MTVRWITPLLGTASGSAIAGLEDAVIIDVRNFVDRGGNSPDSIRPRLLAGFQSLSDGRKTIVCCDHGVSRSNAFAVGILAIFENIPFHEAARKVIDATGEKEIRPDVLTAVRLALANQGTAVEAHRGERWLLTGGRGAMGGLIRRTAPHDIELIAPNRKEVDLLSGSTSLALYAEAKRISRILHFASPRIGNTHRAVGDSIVMLRTVLEAAHALSVPVFIPSRWEVFSGYGRSLTADETTPARPASILGETKFLCESLALTWEIQRRVSVTVFRSALVFGEGVAPHFLRAFIRKARAGEAVTVHSYDNGSPGLDLLTADDWAQAFWSLARSDLTGLYQAGGGGLLTTRQIAEMACTAEGRKCQLEELHVEGKAANIILDFAKLRNAVGWSPACPSREAMIKFLEHAADANYLP